MKQILLIFLLVISIAAQADTDTYTIDDTHSFANFSIRHVVSKTSGTFSDINGKIIIDRNDLSKSSVEAKINAMSVNTSHTKRDNNIRQESDYLDVNKFGWMNFISTKIEQTKKDEGVMTGSLTMHGITKEISFPFRVLGFGYDPWGGQRAGFEAHTTLNAADFGFGWTAKPNPPVGNEIEVTLLIEGIKSIPELKPWK